MMNRREFIKLSGLSPLALFVLPKAEIEIQNGMVFPITFAEDNYGQIHNAVKINSFRKVSLLETLWQSITQFIK